MWFWVSSWSHFGCQVGVQGHPGSLLVRSLTKHRFWVPFWADVGPNLGGKMGPDSPFFAGRLLRKALGKAPDRIFEGAKKRPRYKKLRRSVSDGFGRRSWVARGQQSIVNNGSDRTSAILKRDPHRGAENVGSGSILGAMLGPGNGHVGPKRRPRAKQDYFLLVPRVLKSGLRKRAASDPVLGPKI